MKKFADLMNENMGQSTNENFATQSASSGSGKFADIMNASGVSRKPIKPLRTVVDEISAKKAKDANGRFTQKMLAAPAKADVVKGDLMANVQNRLATAPQTKLTAKAPTAQELAAIKANQPKAMTPKEIIDYTNKISKGEIKPMVSPNPTTFDRVAGTVSGATKDFVGSTVNALDWASKVPATPLWAIKQYNDLFVKDALGKASDTLMDSGAQDIAEAKRGATGLGKTAIDVGVGGLQLAGDIGLAALTGGGSIAPMVARSFGSAAKQAKNSGGSELEQGIYGGLTAATAGLVGKLANVGGVLSKAYGKGALDGVLQKATSSVISKLVKNGVISDKVATGIAAGAGEGLEEMLESTLSPLYQKITYDPNATWNAEQILYDGLVGAIVGGFAGGIGGSNTQNTPNATQPNTITPNLAKPTQNVPQQATQPITNNITPNLVKLPTLEQNAVEAKQTAPEAKTTLPNSVGATSNSFVPEQKTSKVFTNTFQKTDSITDEQRAQMKPEDYQYDVRGKAVNETASQQRVDVDFDGEVADLNSKQQWTDEDVYTSKKILDKVSADAEKSGDYAELNKWTKAIQKRGTTGGQTIEAFKAFQKTPEGAVIKAQQVIAEAEKKLTKKKELSKEVDTKKGRKIKADSDTTKKAMRESANESIRAADPANVAVEWWIRDTSIKLSKQIDANSKNKTARIDSTMQTMLKDLVRITKNSAPQAIPTKIKTNLSTNTLRNYWANSEQYQAAISRAQSYINEKYSNDPETLEIFNNWLAGNGINTWATLGKALQENGVKYNDILMSNWQDKAVLLDNVTNKILADTDLTADEAKSAAQAISDKFYDELAIRAQKKIEQLLKPTTPKQQKTMTQRVNEFVNSGVFDDSAIVDLVSAKYGIPSLTATDVQKIYELNKLAQETDNDYQKRVYLNRAARVVVDKMPVTGKEKVLAVRRIAMLLNPKTLISRNAGGNVIFGLLEDIKDAPGTLVDMATTKIAKTDWRTTSFNPIATAKAEFIGAKKGLTEWGKDIKNKVDTSPTQHEMPQTPALKSTVGKAFEGALNKLLQVGDRPFYEAAKAKRIDELKRLGRDYTSDDAIAEANVYALERVFQNNSGLAKKAMQLRDSLGVIGDIAIPFAQTPANIFDKLADYSPYGYVRAIKKAGTIKDSAWSQKQFVDTLSRSMTGTGILAFAYFAAQAGLISGGDDKEEDEALTYQKKISGWQPYSIIVGDKSYTYDWSTVVGALLSLGADISQSDNAGDTLLAILSNGAKAGINTMFNQSYMEGVAELFGSSSGGKTDIGKGLESMLVGLPASFTPSAFQQIAKIIDPIARDTYDSDPFKRAWNKVKAKIPGLSNTLPAKIGASGTESTNYQGGKLSNILESTLSPGFIGETQKTAIDSEVQRLYKATDDSSVLPNWSEYTSKSGLSFSGNGTEYTMTPQEWEKFQKTRGQYTYKELDKLTKSAEYKNMTDVEKAKAVSSIYSDATTNARMSTVEARGEMYIPSADAGAKIAKYQAAGVTQRQAYNLNKTMSALTPVQGEKEVSDYQRIKTIGSQGYTDKQAIELVGTLYTSKDKSSMLPYLTTSKHLLSLYLTNKDSEMISMSVPAKVAKDSVEYELTDKEKKTFKNTYANYFNSRVTNITTAEQIKKLRDKAFDAAKSAVIQNR